MLNIFAQTFMTATRQDHRHDLDPAGRAGRFLPPVAERWDSRKTPGFRSTPEGRRDAR